MKKLMIAAAIVCAAAMSQAAQINWAVNANSWTYADGTKPGQTVSSKVQPQQDIYIINAQNWAAIKAAIEGGATSFTVDGTVAGILGKNTTTGTKGAIAETPSSSTRLMAGQTYSFAYLVIDTRGDETQYFASSAIPKAAWQPGDETYGEKMSIAFTSTQYGTSGLSGGWQTVAVPEPTSAMLMLLGVAGLALRRRRA